MASDSEASFNDLVTCPYDKAHSIIRGRLSKHLIRCSRNAGKSKKLLVCPYNENHRYNANELNDHINVCPERIRWEPVLQSENIPQQKGALTTIVQCEEDWDNEPDVPSYNPRKYCEENLVVRSADIVGKSKAVRQEIRAKERRRFAEKQ